MTQVFTTARAHTEIPVEHPERHTRPQRPDRAANAGGTGGEVAITAIQHWNAASPACCDRAQIERGMPAGNDDDVRPRLCNRVRHRSDVDTAKAVRVEATAGCGRLKDTVRVAVSKGHVPLKRLTEA